MCVLFKQMLETGNVLLEPLVAKQLSPSSQEVDGRLIDKSYVRNILVCHDTLLIFGLFHFFGS